MEPLLTIGSLTVTAFSVGACLAAFAGCLLLMALTRQTGLDSSVALTAMPLTIGLGVLCGHALYALTRVLIYPLDYERPLAFIFNPALGGFMALGVFAGAWLACLLTASIHHVSIRRLWAALLPALLLVVALIRFCEPLSLLGKGPGVEGGFFPFSYAPEPEYPDDRYVPEFFYAGVYTLCLSVMAARSLSGKRGQKRSALFYFVLYLSGQMFFEVFRQDEYVNATSLITFIRLNQLFAAILLGIIFVAACVRCRTPGKARLILTRSAVLAVSVGACVGLQFFFKKPLPFFGQTVWFANWLVYSLLALTAAGMGWAVLSVLRRCPEKAIR